MPNTTATTIGRRVSLLSTGGDNPRNGEGTFLRLADNAILYAYSRYRGDDWGDHALADIAGIISHDEGETWSEPVILLRADAAASNYMCPSLARMPGGDIGLAYLRKYRDDSILCDSVWGAVLDTVCFVRSSDEGKTWSAPIECTHGTVYDVIENDRLLVLSTGRIVLPVNRHSTVDNSTVDNSTVENGTLKIGGAGRMFLLASDDDGRTWFTLSDEYRITNAPYSDTGLQETVVFEEEGGRLRAFSRTDQLCQYECFSTDGGKTWTENHPIPFFSSAVSPMIVRRVSGIPGVPGTPGNPQIVAVWNPTPLYTTRDQGKIWGRTPLALAISDNDGKTFSRTYLLEDDPGNGYCYPSVFDGGEYLLVGYYHSNDTGIVLNANVIKKVMKSELI
ncbi:MAG: exo-alpha-sialidase [Clostridia bacterium]|nr:exo-alpha-sialidase [Clostridia bacterium]